MKEISTRWQLAPHATPRRHGTKQLAAAAAKELSFNLPLSSPPRQDEAAVGRRRRPGRCQLHQNASGRHGVPRLETQVL